MLYEPLLHIVLYQPEIPPNTGNIGRTCVATGAKLWLIEPLGFQIDEKQLRRAGLDYWPLLEWEAVPDWNALVARLGPPLAGHRAWFFTKTAKRPYTEINFQKGDVLVFGSESSGLPPEILQQHSSQAIRVPMRPEVRSLNLSATVAVAAYEAVRQIQPPIS
ncbi:MAG TPA: tRNA (cytidine(34)-2'-O)-methyltransferase [Pirellulaceae bacterium]